MDSPGVSSSTQLVAWWNSDGRGTVRVPRGVMAVWPDGRILVEDFQRLAYHVFGPEGEFERMVRVSLSNLGIAMQNRLLTERTGEPTLVGPNRRVILDMSAGGARTCSGGLPRTPGSRPG